MGRVIVAVMLVASPLLMKVSAAADVGDPVIAAAGDIACDPLAVGFNGGNGTKNKCQERATSNLIATSGATAVLPIGDEQYECPNAAGFAGSYDPTWGRFGAMTYPAIGNHEYQKTGSAGCDTAPQPYLDYFTSKGAPQVAGPNGAFYYSFDIGTWHLIALNANCTIVLCKAGSTQEQWLKADLAAHPNTCTLAFWHQPRFASGIGKVRSNNQVAALWTDLVNAHADVVLNGHFHYYDRMGKMDANGVTSPSGMREFLVGTGGDSITTKIDTFWSTHEAYVAKFGILRMTLSAGSYSWSFVGIDNVVYDSGTDVCSV